MAIQRAIQNITAVDLIKELTELVKNPDAIIEAHEMARQQIKLTEEEKEKAKTARDFIKQYETLQEDLKRKHEELDSEFSAKVALHDSEKADFNAYMAAIKASHEEKERQIADTFAQLTQKESELDLKHSHHENIIKEFTAHKEVVSCEHDSIREELQKKLQEIEAKLSECSSRESSLDEREAILNDKMDKFKSIFG